MRNVRREPIPGILGRRQERWTRELLAEISKGACADPERLKRLKRKYAHPSVKAALKKMYRFCCYCESRVTTVTKGHIEHRAPQARFPERTFEWENLHLACPNCNEAKSDQWDEDDPILDAVEDQPIAVRGKSRAA